jgi:hypothetical protein
MKFLAAILFCAVILGIPVSAEKLSIEYTFEYPTMESTYADTEAFDRIIMTDAPNAGQIGEPSLPARGAHILLPFGAKLDGVDIDHGDKIKIGVNYHIEPVLQPIPPSLESAASILPAKNMAVYSSHDPFPGSRHENVSVQIFRGYQILILKLRPVEYIPASGELYYYPRITVTVNTIDGGETASSFRGLPEDEIEVASRIDNVDMIGSYTAAEKQGGSSYDLLIITQPELVYAFEPLKDFHDWQGILTEIHTTIDLPSLDPTDVRAYIAERYLNDGISYVIIGADDDVIPAVDLFVQSWEGIVNGTPPLYEYNMPADIYFANLDGTFNYDGDQYWGEPNDGEGGGDVDLFAELYIGRVPVDNATEAERFVSKTIQYLTATGPYLQKVLMTGEQLGYGGPVEYSKPHCEELIDGSDAHGYTTVGVPTTAYDVDRLYDYDWPATYDWPPIEAINRINSGLHIINHLGHSNHEISLKLHINDVLNYFANTDHFFMYNGGCHTGWFDGHDCWLEVVTIKSDYGAFAAIGNARYGYGSSRTSLKTTDSPGQRFHREFLDALYNPEEAMWELGRANQDSKEDNVYRIDEPAMRWTYYQLNLFGDPTVAIKPVRALAFNYPYGIPEKVNAEEEISFDVVISGIGEGVPVPGSGQIHYSISGRPIVSVSMTENSPNEYTASLPMLSCGETVQFYFSAEETAVGTMNYPIPESPYTIRATNNLITPIFDDVFESDKGWTISGGLWARGIPSGGGGEQQPYGGADPETGSNGPNIIGYNLNGDYENGLGEMHITSPSIDCSGMPNVYLSFMRWLGAEQSPYDHGSVRVSNDGVNWTTVWQNTVTICDNTWAPMDLDISDVAADQETVYLRFTMGPTDGGLTFCGWNIDDVNLTSRECFVFTCGDANGDDQVNVGDAVFLIVYVFSGGPPPDPECVGDANGDGGVNVGDAVYLIAYVFSGGPPPAETCCP